MTPAERLRSVTRRGGVDHGLASDAADALAAFASEPASLVVACRRLLAYHPGHGPLWWVCARILAAPDAVAAAREAGRAFDADRTGERLGASLPVLDEGERIAIVGWPYVVDEALAERADLDVLAVRVDGADPVPALRGRRTERRIPVADIWDARVTNLSQLLVPARAIGTDTALVPAGVGALLDEAGAAAREVWLVGGVGRVLPTHLFAAAVAATTTPTDAFVSDDDPSELCALARFDRVAGPRGVTSVADAITGPDCPVVPELLRPLR
ncbi:MAG: hypothetical protein ACT4OX_02090 [Actinomycetota bacterium]